jgi:hypothetical protein
LFVTRLTKTDSNMEYKICILTIPEKALFP